MNQPSPRASAIEQAIRVIAKRRGITLREAADVWIAVIHAQGEAIRQRQSELSDARHN